jgi:predicted RNase H-like HicB family nuclease
MRIGKSTSGGDVVGDRANSGARGFEPAHDLSVTFELAGGLGSLQTRPAADGCPANIGAPDVGEEGATNGGRIMQSFVYHARFEPDDERGIVVTFPEVPEAITDGDDEAEARVTAEEDIGCTEDYARRDHEEESSRSRNSSSTIKTPAP